MGTEFVAKSSIKVPKKEQQVSAACEVQDKLALIAGPGKLQTKISEARGRLARINSNRWRSPLAPGRIKRFLYRAQQPKPEEVDDVREAYSQFCEEKLAFAKRVVSQIEYLRRSDEDFHRETIQQLVALLSQLQPFLRHLEQQSGRDRA